MGEGEGEGEPRKQVYSIEKTEVRCSQDNTHIDDSNTFHRGFAVNSTKY